MAERQFTFESDILPTVEQIAQRVFAGKHNADELIVDTITNAWKNWDANPGHSPKRYAYYGIKGVRSAEREQRTKRSIDAPLRLKISGMRRDCTALETQFRDRDNPARIVGFRLDIEDFCELELNDRLRRIFELLGEGRTAAEVAEIMGVTSSAISQSRRRLAALWYAWQA